MEKIDLYTKDKVKLNKVFIRHQDILFDNEYYLLEQAWIINDNKEILLTRRSFNKSYGGLWEATAGHVKAGETDIEGIQREIYEELGLNIKKSDFNSVKSLIKKQAILDIWIIRSNIKIEDLNQEYLVVTPADVEVDEAYFLKRIVDENGEVTYETIDEEEEFNIVAETYELLGEELEGLLDK